MVGLYGARPHGGAGGGITPGGQLPRARFARAARVLRGFDGAKPEAVRIGVRPMPVDRHSVVGPIPGVEGYYLAVTHSGVTLAAFLGQAVAEEIAHSRPDVRLEPFRPARFFVA